MTATAAECNGRRLTLAVLAEAKRLTADFLRGLGLADLPGGGVGIPYYDEAGTEIAVKRRTALKATDGSYWPKGLALRAYGAWQLDAARKAEFLILVEGESDCWALWSHGLPALGIPGANAAKTLDPEYLVGIAKVYVVREPDQGGPQFIKGISRRLADMEFEGRAFEMRMPAGTKDPADLHAKNPAAFADAIQDAICCSEEIDFRHGDAWEHPADRSRDTPKQPNESTYQFTPIDSATFATADYRLSWLIQRLLVEGQPCIVGGPRKALKTSLLVALAVALGSGAAFLGRFRVYRRVRVALLSGESGEATLQETARRICHAQGLDLSTVDCLWAFQLPQIGNTGHMAALQSGLKANGVQVVIIDPLYLCLLAGQADQGLQASNLFDMGPLLLSVSRACLDTGCTPILIHHARKNLSNPDEPLELEDLAFAGIQEFARQWILLSRRKKYEPGSGLHQLWLSVGGSAGHGGLWAVNVNEGQLNDDFQGRTWEVRIASVGEAREEEAIEGDSIKNQRRAAEEKNQDARLLNALDELDPTRLGISWAKAQAQAHLGNATMTRAVIRLTKDQVIEELDLQIAVGSGAKRAVKGLRRRPS
jgi:replicative DNA helicase